ncbi:MAG: hypothetical protein WAW54_17895 [Parvibaculum sedimenti]|uniref:hypothetical protein n=1 Tax=Parvibaculum sedimenti TaxID=2608632 RepID=UPI003BB5FB57
MQQLSVYLNQAVELAAQGFDTVNSMQGIIIAVVAAGLMRRYKQIIGWTIGATLVHEGANIVRRMLAHDASPLPNFGDLAYWKLVGIRLLGYLVAISVVYMVRRLVLRS